MRSIRRTFLLCFLSAIAPALTSGVCPQTANAAVIPFTFTELTQKSKMVVTGEVVGLRSYRAPFHDTGEVIFTDVTIRIDRALKGSPEGKEITIQVLGGQIGEQWQKCPESARYEKGEKVLVFVRDYHNALWTTGWFQGKYKLDASGSKVLGSEHTPIPNDASLAQVEAAVRLAAQAGGSTAPASKDAATKGGAK